jgi:hypothetical protein
MQLLFKPPHEPGLAIIAPKQRLEAHCSWPSSEVARAATAKGGSPKKPLGSMTR